MGDMMKPTPTFADLAKINVNEHIEKKNGLSYLSWAWAVDQLLRADPSATWEYSEPAKWGDTVMVFCRVNAFGKTMTAQLPVMDHRNKAISNPDAMAVNTAMQRCLAKAIALHGIGLYIYAGEDLPLGAEVKDAYEDLCKQHHDSIQAIKTAIGDFIASGKQNHALLSSGAEAWFELDNDTKQALWKAPTKGGVFTTEERAIMQLREFRESFYGPEQGDKK